MKKQLTPQRQGMQFESQVSKELHALLNAGHLLIVHKMVNAVGTPFDFLAAGEQWTYGIECKALLEGKTNHADSFRLSCLNDNEWSGMRAWSKSRYRRAWVVWKSIRLTGDEYVFAAPFTVIDHYRANGIKQLSLTAPGVMFIGKVQDINLLRLFRGDDVA